MNDLLRDVLGRAVVIREALEEGDAGYAAMNAADLERDLAAAVSREEAAA